MHAEMEEKQRYHHTCVGKYYLWNFHEIFFFSSGSSCKNYFFHRSQHFVDSRRTLASSPLSTRVKMIGCWRRETFNGFSRLTSTNICGNSIRDFEEQIIRELLVYGPAKMNGNTTSERSSGYLQIFFEKLVGWTQLGWNRYNMIRCLVQGIIREAEHSTATKELVVSLVDSVHAIMARETADLSLQHNWKDLGFVFVETLFARSIHI